LESGGLTANGVFYEIQRIANEASKVPVSRTEFDDVLKQLVDEEFIVTAKRGNSNWTILRGSST